jgi:hypothetical protein
MRRTGVSGDMRLKSSAMSIPTAWHTQKSVSIEGDTTPRSIWLSMLMDMPAFVATWPWFFRVFSRNIFKIFPIEGTTDLSNTSFITLIIKYILEKSKNFICEGL